MSVLLTNGIKHHAHIPSKPFLKRYRDDEIHDLICIGFGPASLAIAVALHDALESKDPALRTYHPKVRFLERKESFTWHAGMLLPETKMQISFVKDLATLRNPRSRFTFLNYLHEKNRLVSFINLGTFLPQRIEYEDYLKWAASHFAEVVHCNQDVYSVEPGYPEAEGGISYFYVHSYNPSTGEARTIKTKHVIIAIGGRPNIPECINSTHPRVIHSSQYATSISKIFHSSSHPKSVAVIGSGQSAAEVFYDIPSRFPNSKSYLLIRGSALRPSDDSPFVNEIFDPSRVNDMYSQAPEIRARRLAEDEATNYGVVRLELLESIYSRLYSYRIQYGNEIDWPQRILPRHTVVGMTDLPESNSQSAIRLHFKDDSKTNVLETTPRDGTIDVDLVIVASGYRRDAHRDIIKGVEHLMLHSQGGLDNYGVGRDYRIPFKDGAVRENVGIWLQGCCESTHGLSDTLLSILATRAGELVNNIFGSTHDNPYEDG